MQQDAFARDLSPSATEPRRGDGAYRRQAWERYRSAVRRFAQQPEDRRTAEELEMAVEGLRRAAAVAAWRRG